MKKREGQSSIISSLECHAPNISAGSAGEDCIQHHSLLDPGRLCASRAAAPMGSLPGAGAGGGPHLAPGPAPRSRR